MNNPYEVLGIPQGAPLEQVKAAYRELARRYQQEAEQIGPVGNIAQHKLRELDEAYDAIIMSMGAGSVPYGQGSQNSYHNSGYTDYNGYGYTDYAVDLSAVRAKIAANQIDDAELLLDGIAEEMRNAEWYYLKGTVQQYRGWLEEAARNFEIAYNTEPANDTYRSAFQSVRSARMGGYKVNEKDKEDGCSPCRICSGLLCADCCCEAMGGDLIPCC